MIYWGGEYGGGGGGYGLAGAAEARGRHALLVRGVGRRGELVMLPNGRRLGEAMVTAMVDVCCGKMEP